MESRRPSSLKPVGLYLGRDYSDALEALGAVPIHILLIPQKDYIRDCLARLDGILLPGSDTDVDPHRFGEEPLPKLKKIKPEKEATDLLVLAEAENLNLPIFAICFGMQISNVSRGGTLIQDIKTQIPNCLQPEQGGPPERNSRSIEFSKKSFFSRFVPNE